MHDACMPRVHEKQRDYRRHVREVMLETDNFAYTRSHTYSER